MDVLLRVPGHTGLEILCTHRFCLEFFEKILKVVIYAFLSQIIGNIGQPQTGFIRIGDFMVELNQGVSGRGQGLVRVPSGRDHV